MSGGREVTHDEARHVIHQFGRDGAGPIVHLPVPGASRRIGLQDWGDDTLVIITSHPADVIKSMALTTWGNRPLKHIQLRTHQVQDGPPYIPTMEEWKNVFNHLSWEARSITGLSMLDIQHYHEPISRYAELLPAIASSLPNLMRMKGLRELSIGSACFAGKQVLAFLDDLSDRKYKLIPDRDSACTRLVKDGWELKLWFKETTIRGEANVLEEVMLRSEDTGLIRKATWREEDGSLLTLLGMEHRKSKVTGTTPAAAGRMGTEGGNIVDKGRGHPQDDSRERNERILEQHINKIERNLYKFMDVNFVFIAELRKHDILPEIELADIKSETRPSKRVESLMELVRKDPIPRVRALLTSLVANKQPRVVDEFDTNIVRASLGYPSTIKTEVRLTELIQEELDKDEDT